MNIKFFKYDAIRSLVGGGLTQDAKGVIHYNDGQSPPSDSEIDAEVIRLQDEFDALQFQRDRAVSYPSLDDVTVALAEKAEGDSTMWDKITAERTAVKEKYPKP